MINELYIIGDQSRLIVKNIIKQFALSGCKITVVNPLAEEIDRLPNSTINLIVILSEDMDFTLIRKISIYQKQLNYHLCFIGRLNTLSFEDDNFFKQIPSIKISSFSFDAAELLDLLNNSVKLKKHILVVDDEPIILRSIKAWLGDEFELSLVNSGETALEFLDMHPVDLVLLDYKMPTMDGPTVLRLIRNDERLKNLPVIFLTANNERQGVITAMQYKPDGYILKTKTPEEIKAAVVEFFKKRVIRA